MLKMMLIALCGGLLITSSLTAHAKKTDAEDCSPRHIKYCEKEKSIFSGKEYLKYNVKCRNGKVRVITAWNKRTKWCVGTSSQCSDNQMKTAMDACAS